MAAPPPPPPAAARVGRELQRWDGDTRLVAGCVPWRGRGERGFEVLLVQSTKKRQWIFPKGGWESDETAEQAARREALEEAGVEGEGPAQPLRTVEFRSSKGRPTRLAAFLLRVSLVREEYPESGQRDRRWFAPAEAAAAVTRPEMAELLQCAREELVRQGFTDDAAP